MKPGDTVTKGQLLMTVEGMKMEVSQDDKILPVPFVAYTRDDLC